MLVDNGVEGLIDTFMLIIGCCGYEDFMFTLLVVIECDVDL